jgi:tetratricopeptide (TPR) repeat protein
MGRPDVALRLVAEALAEKPDAEETVELRIVESGARLDLGEDAAARLVLEAELGGRPEPAMLEGADPSRLRIASAYADLLQAQGQEDAAAEWLTAIAAADPDDLIGAVDRLGIEFTEVELDLGDVDLLDEDGANEDGANEDGADDNSSAPPERVEELPEDDHGLGLSFDQEVAAEVAELLGETEPQPEADEAGTSDTENDQH